jgi:hypothetical protein
MKTMKNVTLKDLIIRTVIAIGMILAVAGGYYAYLVNQ